uniref:Uncharacterized protein n=1 Tax=Arundo donax TaxID=35708 RepID=A0A0A9EIG7_ARUDO
MKPIRTTQRDRKKKQQQQSLSVSNKLG